MVHPDEVVLFDIDCKKRVCWSPNTVKPRYVLAHKGVPYKTTWVSYPDIDQQLRTHGQDEAETVTCPVLKYGERYVPDSWAIAQFLEESHPTPTIFPAGLHVHEQFNTYVQENLKKNFLLYIIAQVPGILDARGAEYFARTRVEKFGRSLKSISAPGDAGFLPAIREGLVPIIHALRQSSAFIHGKEFGYGDVEILGLLQWVKEADEEKFRKIVGLDGDGTMMAWWERCMPYMKQLK